LGQSLDRCRRQRVDRDTLIATKPRKLCRRLGRRPVANTRREHVRILPPSRDFHQGRHAAKAAQAQPWRRLPFAELSGYKMRMMTCRSRCLGAQQQQE
jgi:hypothetical protein